MALLHHATLAPSKLDLIGGWLPTQPYRPTDADASRLEKLASFRFDDPAGKVGVETLLVRAGDTVLQIPLTYREEPLDGAEASLIGTMEHSVLGTRWAYDGVGDPVYLSELVRVVATGGAEVEQHYEENGVAVTKPGDAQVHGSGHPGAVVPATAQTPEGISGFSDATTSVARAGGADVTVVRAVGGASARSVRGPEPDEQTLTGTWDGARNVVLAIVRVTS